MLQIIQNYHYTTAYLINHKSSGVAEMGDRLATIDIGRKVGPTVPLYFFCLGELGPHLTRTCGLGRGLPAYQVTS